MTATATATEQVLAVLQSLGLQSSGGLPVEAQAFLLTLFGGDLGGGGECPDPNPGTGKPITDPWTLEVGYTYWTGSLDSFPDWPGLPVGHGLVSTALGPFQITGTTARYWMTLPGAPQDMHPPSQCVLAWIGAQHDYKHATDRDLLADLRAGNLLGNVQSALIDTWPGGTRGFVVRYQRAAALIKTPPSPPPPELSTITGTLRDNTGGTWSVTATKTTLSGVAGMAIGALGMGHFATAPLPALCPVPIPPPAQTLILQMPRVPPNYFEEWLACYDAIKGGNL